MISKATSSKRSLQSLKVTVFLSYIGINDISLLEFIRGEIHQVDDQRTPCGIQSSRYPHGCYTHHRLSSLSRTRSAPPRDEPYTLSTRQFGGVNLKVVPTCHTVVRLVQASLDSPSLLYCIPTHRSSTSFRLIRVCKHVHRTHPRLADSTF